MLQDDFADKRYVNIFSGIKTDSWKTPALKEVVAGKRLHKY